MMVWHLVREKRLVGYRTAREKVLVGWKEVSAGVGLRYVRAGGGRFGPGGAVLAGAVGQAKGEEVPPPPPEGTPERREWEERYAHLLAKPRRDAGTSSADNDTGSPRLHLYP